MTQILNDGTVIPSALSMMGVGRHQDMGLQSNVAMRLGEVKEIIYPDSPKSVSGRYLEYRVAVQQRDSSETGAIVEYPNCIAIDAFGSVADVVQHTFRPDTSLKSRVGEARGVGAQVLILCVDGQSSRSYIIGGVRQDPGPDKKDDGHNLFFEFNGLSARINKDGEFKLQFRGATDVKNAITGDDASQPTTIEIKKNGNLEITTKDSKQFIKINHADKKVEFLIDEEWNVKVNKKVVENYGAEWECTSGSTITLTASSNMILKSSGVRVGGATDAWLMGTTFRGDQQQLHSQLASALTALGAQLAIAGAGITASLPMLLPPTLKPIMAPVAAALVGAPAICAQMVSAIAQFEAKASATHLSKVNLSD